jgi:hypothetical protein
MIRNEMLVWEYEKLWEERSLTEQVILDRGREKWKGQTIYWADILNLNLLKEGGLNVEQLQSLRKGNMYKKESPNDVRKKKEFNSSYN